MFKITFDNRETKLISIATQQNLIHSVAQLNIGDILVSSIIPNEEQKIIYIFERKTIEDLIASIKDGRYNEQKTRLNAIVSRGNALKYFYIIEGLTDTLFKTEEAMFQGSLISIIVRDSIGVFRTKNINETFEIVVRLLQRLEKSFNDKKDEFNILKISKNTLECLDEAIIPQEQTNNQPSYLDTIKIKKNANITPKICNVLALSNIPGISNKTAETILSNYNNSIFKLLKAYEAIDMLEELEDVKIKKKENMICNISLGIRKVGSVISKRVYEFLYCNS
jgi:crossover junction endonuclease MUS81